MKKETTGVIFNIQRFSIHDGPGIRDLVFLKGCPLRCAWCSNPESQHFCQELSYRRSKCVGCHACVPACPQGAIRAGEDGGIEIDRGLCRRCFTCARVCCSRALSAIGEEISARELVRRVMGQHLSWRAQSGVTLSGGEPLCQPEFTAEVFRLLHEEGTTTALETCGCAPFEAIEQVAPHCDLIHFDLKLMDTELHRRYTGADNQGILDNLYRLSRRFPHIPLIVRTPLIPGVNDSGENLSATAEFLRGLPSLRDYELLPYHDFGEGKYRQLGRAYSLAGLERPDKAAVRAKNDALREIIFSG